MSNRRNVQANACHICESFDPPSLDSKVQPKRACKGKQSRNTGIDWIQRTVCKSWCHTLYCGLTQREVKKLDSPSQFFKCIPCCVKVSCCVKSLQYESKTCYSKVTTPSSETVCAQHKSSATVSHHSSASTSTLSINQAEVSVNTSLSNAQQELEENTERENIIIVNNLRSPAKFIRSDSILKDSQVCSKCSGKICIQSSKRWPGHTC